MTNKNKPKVTMVTGNVNIMSTGLTNKLRRMSNAATTIAVRKPDTLMPGKILAKTTTAIALSNISTKVLSDLDYCIGGKNKKNC